MNYTFKFVSPEGREWRLMDPNPNGVFINEGTLANQFTGALKETASIFVGAPGQLVASADSQFLPITGTLQCTVSAEFCDGSVEKVWREFREDWESTSPENPGSFVLNREGGLGELILPVRLSGGALPGVGSNPAELDEIPVAVSVVADKGQWLFRDYGTGIVTVTNSGNGFIRPKIRWVGAGGVVELPSGATFTLPPVSEPRTISLDYTRSFEVLDDGGVLDDALWRELRGEVIGEGIPQKESHTYTLPEDAVLLWDLAFLNPWR